jgi:hypothetical protein
LFLMESVVTNGEREAGHCSDDANMHP